MRFYLILGFLIFANPISHAQTFDEVLKEAFDFYSQNQNYQISNKYKLFKGLDGNKAYEEYEGVFMKKGGSYYQKLGPMELLVNDSSVIKLNWDDKEILISNQPEVATPSLFNYDFETIKKCFEDVVLISKNNQYRLEMKGKANNALKLAKLEIYINKETKLIEKQILIPSNVIDFSVFNSDSRDRDFDLARIEITYHGFKEIVDNEVFSEKRYYTQVGDKKVLGKEFKSFELVPIN